MPIGEPSPQLIWSTNEATTNDAYYFSTADNSFTIETPKIIVPVPMREIPWPPELLKDRANVILALDGGAAVQCPDCGAYGVLQPDESYAECREKAHEVDQPLDWGGGYTYGGISQGTNVNWQITTTSSTNSSTLTDLRALIIK